MVVIYVELPRSVLQCRHESKTITHNEMYGFSVSSTTTFLLKTAITEPSAVFSVSVWSRPEQV